MASKYILAYTKYESFANFPYEEYPIAFDDPKEAYKLADEKFPRSEWNRVVWEIDEEDLKRERFEDWYLSKFWEGSEAGREYLAQESCGGYTYAKPAELWEVWQAASSMK